MYKITMCMGRRTFCAINTETEIRSYLCLIINEMRLNVIITVQYFLTKHID